MNMPTTLTKRCGVCHLDLPTSAFFSSSRTTDGLYFRCRTCNRAVVRAWRQANREQLRERERERRRERRQKRLNRNLLAERLLVAVEAALEPVDAYPHGAAMPPDPGAERGGRS
jgi:hypothetical protein